MLHDNLIFVIGSPRSGSTLLQRMLGSHSRIYTHPEPHLLTPLYYLGYYATVDKAPYDHINAAQALRELAQELPNGESDYLDALRAYASTIYERVLAPTGKPFFLDKTPAYALILPFITKLYPRAKYVVLTRHPLAILHSVAHSFFAGDYQAAHDTNPIVERYVPAIARFILEHPVPFVHTQYETLVQQPESEMRRILEYLGLPYETACVEYGKTPHVSKSFGDPFSVARFTRPVSDLIDTWVDDLLAREDALALAQREIAALEPAHLEAWGYTKSEIFVPLSKKASMQFGVEHRLDSKWKIRLRAFLRGGTPAPTLLNTYRLKRMVLLRLRKNIANNVIGKALRKVRYYCDVLLRE